jgi:acyl-CoA thioesterase FadM
MSARLIADAFVALPLTGQAIDAEGIVANPRFAAMLREALDRFIQAIRGDEG